MQENFLLGFNTTISHITAVTIQFQATFSANILVVQNAISDHLTESNSFLLRLVQAMTVAEYAASSTLTVRTWSSSAVFGMGDKNSLNDSRYRTDMATLGWLS